MRLAALVLAALLIVPAMAAIAARARTTPAGSTVARGLETIFVALPLLGLALLLVLAAGADA